MATTPFRADLDVTPEAVYRRRREFMRGAVALAIVPEADAGCVVPAGGSGADDGPDTAPRDTPTPYDAITNSNNSPSA